MKGHPLKEKILNPLGDTGMHSLIGIIVCMLSCVWLLVILWTVACQAPLSMGFSKQEYWSGLTCPPPGDCPDPRIKPTHVSCISCTAGGFFTAEPLEKPIINTDAFKRKMTPKIAYLKEDCLRSWTLLYLFFVFLATPHRCGLLVSWPHRCYMPMWVTPNKIPGHKGELPCLATLHTCHKSLLGESSMPVCNSTGRGYLEACFSRISPLSFFLLLILIWIFSL